MDLVEIANSISNLVPYAAFAGAAVFATAVVKTGLKNAKVMDARFEEIKHILGDDNIRMDTFVSCYHELMSIAPYLKQQQEAYGLIGKLETFINF